MKWFGLGITAVLLWPACGRLAVPCPDRGPTGAELIRGADVVLVATVSAGEVAVLSVLQGRLRELGDRRRVTVDGLPDGLGGRAVALGRGPVPAGGGMLAGGNTVGVAARGGPGT